MLRATKATLTVLTLACFSSACDVGSSGLDAGGGSPSGQAGVPTGGAAPNAGTAGAPLGGTGGAPAGAGQFTLLFRDDFDQLDGARWQLMTHSWDTNLALFSDKTATVEDGELVLSLLDSPEGTVDASTSLPKPYLGAEVRSIDTLTYGRVRARMKFAKGSAVVSSLVTIYTPWPADDWNELDMECLGSAPAKLQFNTMVYTGAPTTPPVTTPVTPTQEPFKPVLDFDPTADFHVYELEWTPTSARFSVDDAVLYTWTKHIERLKLPQNVLLTIWASSSVAWAGPVGADTSMAQARYDWVELYRYQP
jgi:beta-glucanase (GH16 family)